MTHAPLPPVDVVIATRNRPELLRQALAAVLGQTYEGAVNVIVVFDQTEPDQSLEQDLGLGSGSRTVTVVANNRKPGLAGARNTGIQTGTSSLVAFCDDDDCWFPDKLQLQVASLEDPSALTSVSGIEIEYGDHRTSRVPSAEEMTVQTLVRSRVMAAHPSTVVVRREALLGPIGLVDEEIPGSHGEDYDWILRAAAAGGVVVVPQPLVRVLWGQSMFSQKWLTIIAATDYLLDKHRAFHEDPKALGRVLGQRAFALSALGRRREALGQAAKVARLNPRELRAYIAAAVALRVVSAPRVMDLAHRRGRGI